MDNQRIQTWINFIQFFIGTFEARQNSPNNNALRYFNASEKAEAEKIARPISKLLEEDIQVKYFSGYEDSRRIRPRHFELWMSHVS